MSTTPPDWNRLTHRGRCQRLARVRRAWGRRYYGKLPEERGRTVVLDGAWIDDVPSFYLALGEAVHGPGGYFGGDLDALSDCFCGGFGVRPPFTIRLRDFERVRQALDTSAWRRFHQEAYKARKDPEDDAPPNEGAYDRPYFDVLVEVLTERGAQLIPDDAPE